MFPNKYECSPVTDTIPLILSVLTPPERRRSFVLLGLCIPLGASEVAGVLGAIPFILVAANPDNAEAHRLITRISAPLGDISGSALLVVLGLGALFIVLASVAIRTMHLYLMTRLARDIGVSLQTRVLAVHLKRPQVQARRRHGADLQATVLSEVEEVVEAVVLNALRVAAYLSTAVCILLLLVVTDPVAGLVMLVVIGAGYLAVFGQTRRILWQLGQARVGMTRDRHRILQEAMGGLRELQLAHREDAALERFTAAAGRLGALRARTALIKDVPRGALEVLIFGSLILLTLWLLLVRADGGAAILPVVAVYALAAARLFPLLQRLYKAFAEIQVTAPALRAVSGELDTVVATWAGAQATPLPLQREIRLESVYFRYPDAGRAALSAVDLRIAARSTVGLVGETGAGKSTVADLLLGLVSPDIGRVWVDDVAITPENRRCWQRSVGYVPQDIFLTDASIAENIAFGHALAEIDTAALDRAVSLAGLSGLIRSLPAGLATQVGERGVRLSGGERQRIAIARGLYRDPALIVFDEATSALDTVTEMAVMRAVRAMGRDKTIVIVAHRLSTVRNCDEIYLFDEGQVTDSGSYEALLRRNDRFRALHDACP